VAAAVAAAAAPALGQARFLPAKKSSDGERFDGLYRPSQAGDGSATPSHDRSFFTDCSTDTRALALGRRHPQSQRPTNHTGQHGETVFL
jgi:hypothetical protein